MGGPAAPLPCQLPFRFGGKLRTTCITGEQQLRIFCIDWILTNYLPESDPEGKAWCSTRVEGEARQHVVGGNHWAHCGPDCPADPVVQQFAGRCWEDEDCSEVQYCNSSNSTCGESSLFTVAPFKREPIISLIIGV